MLSKTNIEYGEFNWQIYRGCLHKPQGVCPVPNCWAEKVSKRQGWDFHKPKLLTENLLDPLKRKKPARILVNFAGDLFGDWIDPNQWVRYDEVGVKPEPNLDGDLPIAIKMAGWIEHAIYHSPQHTFLFLTKAPQNIWKIEWPDNCWMGATCWDWESFAAAVGWLSNVKAKHQWLSIEPLLERIGSPGLFDELIESAVDWVVVGSQSNPTVYPKADWMQEIVEVCDNAGIKVWLKDNLNPMFAANNCALYKQRKDKLFTFRDFKEDGSTAWHLRQEYPKVRV